MRVVRAFIAVDLDAEVVARLAQVLDDLRREIGDHSVRWVPAENIHLTLKFLGDVSVNNLPLLQNALSAEAHKRSAFALSVGGLGAFPRESQPRVLWVGVEAPAVLMSLQRGIEVRMERLGYARERRTFEPHLTLGRVSRNADVHDIRRVARLLQEYKLGFLGVSEVKAVHLFRSDLRPGGAVYTRLFSAPLIAREP